MQRSCPVTSLRRGSATRADCTRSWIQRGDLIERLVATGPDPARSCSSLATRSWSTSTVRRILGGGVGSLVEDHQQAAGGRVRRGDLALGSARPGPVRTFLQPAPLYEVPHDGNDPAGDPEHDQPDHRHDGRCEGRHHAQHKDAEELQDLDGQPWTLLPEPPRDRRHRPHREPHQTPRQRRRAGLAQGPTEDPVRMPRIDPRVRPLRLPPHGIVQDGRLRVGACVVEQPAHRLRDRREVGPEAGSDDDVLPLAFPHEWSSQLPCRGLDVRHMQLGTEQELNLPTQGSSGRPP